MRWKNVAAFAERNRKMSKDPKWLKAITASNRKRAKDPNFGKKISAANTLSVADHERKAKRVGTCLIYPAQRAARRVYQLRHGKLPSEILVCHTCDNPSCIEDKHHFPGTKKDNARDALKKGRLKFDHKNFKFNGPHSKKSREKISLGLKLAWREGRFIRGMM